MSRRGEAVWKVGSKTFAQRAFSLGPLLGLESNHFRDKREWAGPFRTATIE